MKRRGVFAALFAAFGAAGQVRIGGKVRGQNVGVPGALKPGSGPVQRVPRMTTVSEHNPILERFTGKAPVDVTALAEALGLSVYEDDDLPEGVSGKIYQDRFAPCGFSISVRASDPYVRRRFTLAHEIAHFILHRDRIGASLSDDALYRGGLSNMEEVQANRLAAQILMPKDLVRHYATQYGNEPGLLSSLFKVSEQSMRIRLGL